MPVLGLLLCAMAAIGLGAAPEKPTPEKPPKSHGYAVTGTVARLDAAKKSFVVRSSNGTETTLVRTAATKINGEALKAGDHVAVRWLERDGKKIATSIRIEAPAVAGATPPAPTAPSSQR